MLAAETTNGSVIQAEIAWFEQMLTLRFQAHSGEAEYAPIHPPALHNLSTPYAEAVRAAGLSPDERLVLILALLPQVRPAALDALLLQNPATGRPFTEFGGAPDNGTGFRPTRETALFLLAGDDIDARIAMIRLLDPGAPLLAHGLITAGGELAVPPHTLRRLLTGEKLPPIDDLPLRPLTTSLEWSDLILDAKAREQVEEIVLWERHGRELLEGWPFGATDHPGCRALFLGAAGSGKATLAAALAKWLGVPAWRIGLGQLLDQWTERTAEALEALFRWAEVHGALLFFDEAEALLEHRDANDRQRNQWTAYLLQRIEDSPVVVILASNVQALLDDAFERRFQTVIHFTMPGAEERLALWHRLAHPHCEKEEFERLAKEYELNASEILDVLRFAALRALADGRPIETSDIEAAIARRKPV